MMNRDDLKTLFSERMPYSEHNRLGGGVIVFDSTYILHLREAFMSGCVLKMSEESLILTDGYIDYCNGLEEQTDVYKALDETLIDIVKCRYEDYSTECTLNSVFEFEKCGVE